MAIIDVLEKKVIPWVDGGAIDRMVVADETADARPLPEGMRITPCKLKGRRVAVKGPRHHRHMSSTVARWPESGLIENRLPVILCFISGREDYQVGERIYHCSEGHFLLVPPRAPFQAGDSYRARKTGEIPDILSFSTWDNHLQCCLCHGVDGNILFPNPRVVRLLDMVIDEALAHQSAEDRLGTNVFRAFLTLLRRELREDRFYQEGTAQFDHGIEVEDVDPIQRVVEHVRTHLKEPLNIDDAANRALMSRTQFTRRFRETTGRTFVEFVTHHRMEQAKFLLRDTEWSVSAISEFVGFSDNTRLRRIFNQHVGMSLTEYRQKSRAGADRTRIE